MKPNTPEQTEAIKRFMKNRKRQLRTVNRSYPKFTEGMSTAKYVGMFYDKNGLGKVFDYFDRATLNTKPCAILNDEVET